MDILPQKTEKILRLIKKYDNRFNMFTFRTSSDDPNWERIQFLEAKGYVLTQPADYGPPTYFISPLGEVYLEDIKALRKAQMAKWVRDNLVAILALAISIFSLVYTFSGT